MLKILFQEISTQTSTSQEQSIRKFRNLASTITNEAIASYLITMLAYIVKQDIMSVSQIVTSSSRKATLLVSQSILELLLGIKPCTTCLLIALYNLQSLCSQILFYYYLAFSVLVIRTFVGFFQRSRVRCTQTSGRFIVLEVTFIKVRELLDTILRGGPSQSSFVEFKEKEG